MDSDWAPQAFEGFEGLQIETVEATVPAVTVRLARPLGTYDRFQVVVDCMVIGAGDYAAKDKQGLFGFSEVAGRRRLACVATDARIVRLEDEKDGQ